MVSGDDTTAAGATGIYVGNVLAAATATQIAAATAATTGRGRRHLSFVAATRPGIRSRGVESSVVCAATLMKCNSANTTPKNHRYDAKWEGREQDMGPQGFRRRRCYYYGDNTAAKPSNLTLLMPRQHAVVATATADVNGGVSSSGGMTNGSNSSSRSSEYRRPSAEHTMRAVSAQLHLLSQVQLEMESSSCPTISFGLSEILRTLRSGTEV